MKQDFYDIFWHVQMPPPGFLVLGTPLRLGVAYVTSAGGHPCRLTPRSTVRMSGTPTWGMGAARAWPHPSVGTEHQAPRPRAVCAVPRAHGRVLYAPLLEGLGHNVNEGLFRGRLPRRYA